MVDFVSPHTFAIRMTQNFKALVLTYKTAPVSIREQVSLNELAGKRLLHFIRDYTTASDVLVVSTCNRTEVYYNADKDFSEEIFTGLALVKQLKDRNFQSYFIGLTEKKYILQDTFCP